MRAVLQGLDEALVHGMLGPSSPGARLRGDIDPGRTAVTRWLHAQEHVPRTPRKGVWYAVDYDKGGRGIVGSLDCEYLQ